MYDHARKRLAQRFGRERGLRVFIPIEELERAGFADQDPVYYRVRGWDRGRVMVTLHTSP